MAKIAFRTPGASPAAAGPRATHFYGLRPRRLYNAPAMELLFFLQDAAAGGAAPQAPASGPGDLFKMLPMFAMIFVVMYFLMIRPQNKQRKERDAMIAAL